MKKNINVLIIGANFTNKGAEAMLKVVKQQLQRNHARVTCYMVCRGYERELAESAGFLPVFDTSAPRQGKVKGFMYRVKGKLYKVITGKTLPWYFPFPFGEIEEIVDRLDAVIDISGFAYADSWGKPMIDETIRLISICKQRQVKIFFMPQAWGPFELAGVSKSARKMLMTADGFYARDAVSRQYLAKLLDRAPVDIPMLSDIVFSMGGEEAGNERPIHYPDRPATEKRLRIGISPNIRVYEKLTGAGPDNTYMRVLLALCRHCMETLGAEITLIPNELFPDGVIHTDDRTLCRQIYQLLGKPEACTLLDGYASAETIRGHIRDLDLLVSSRFHALIFGFLERRPVMAISWSHKYRELFELFDLEKYVIESDAIDERSVIARFQELLAEKDDVTRRIDARIPSLKERVDHMFNRLLA
ncbi:polysaccharide pyruvyl transferase family protein [Parapedobacter sp. 10938]|uniref:polysaccharide pyruvyl transferase family protein n=1 Tax=Parapedobacter flavus TaxID=3110225 RepID=UPI002DB62C6D|nr:polysaccharide pyruvyl transferase family protein [Parapedobacter sp. 10938]MEC3879893.1 polysaccharide pyruvyl transferase family protein [Parapedobacter sp. 10938]